MNTDVFMDTFTWYIPIIGHPSAGKSTLIRLLTGKKVAVGKKSGTTKKIKTIPLSEHLAILDFPGFGKVTNRSKSFAEHLQQKVIDELENLTGKILVGILVSDVSNMELVAKKLDNKGFIPIDFELTEFLQEISTVKPIVLGNKIDKLQDQENLDRFASYFPEHIDYFPVSLKEKLNMESFLFHLQMICNDNVGDELADYFWKP